MWPSKIKIGLPKTWCIHHCVTKRKELEKTSLEIKLQHYSPTIVSRWLK
jgi:hypothetical protein